jgi:murein DD-endopeptidase MepM/ murein hydrolase activator NlpD
LDIANDTGTPEVAADGGKVVWAGWGDYGIYVEIDHGNGFHTIYAHMSKVLVNKDQMVAKGQLLGLMGATGRATGPHLHFEIRYQGVPQNPLDLLP